MNIHKETYPLLDQQTIIRAYQTLAGEIAPEALLEKLLPLLMEYSGARTGALLIIEGDLTRTLARMDPSGFRLTHPEREEDGGISPLIANYVLQTGQTLLLDDVRLDQRFSADPILKAHKTRSLLCHPLKRREQNLGLIYLENSLLRGVFTAKKRELLELLSSNLALNLENALIYKNQRQELEKRTKELISVRELQERMNPHFLFNSLNLVHNLLQKDPQRADRVLLLLAERYRYLTEYAHLPLIDFQKEWEFMERYLEIMRLRFVDRVEIYISRPRRLPEFQIPPLSLQPIVENSFKYGFGEDKPDLKIRIELENLGDGFQVRFIDNGPGLGENVSAGRSMDSIRNRLSYFYKTTRLHLESPDTGGVQITLFAAEFNGGRDNYGEDI